MYGGVASAVATVLGIGLGLAARQRLMHNESDDGQRNQNMVSTRVPFYLFYDLEDLVKHCQNKDTG